MKQKVTQLGLAIALAASTAIPMHADPIFSFDFEDGKDSFPTHFTVNDANNDSYTWKWYTYGYSGEYNYAQCYSYSAYGRYQDYMTTVNSYTLEPGHAYRLRYQAWHDDSSGDGAVLTVGYGTSNDPTSMQWMESDNLLYINKYNGQKGEWFEKFIEVPTAGQYYFSFQANNGSGASIDNITLEDFGSPSTPSEVNLITITPGENFATTATISFTLPSSTIVGNDLTSISKVEILRNGTLATTLTDNLTPGEVCTWEDTNAGTGFITYSIIVYSGDLASAVKEKTAYVGPLTANSVTDLKAESENDKDFTITWTAPTKTTTNLDLDATLIKYNVYRVVNNEATLIGEQLTETTCTDSYSSSTVATLSYRVEVIYGETTSEAAETTPIEVGAHNLPLAASFANATMDAGWQAKIVSGDKNWAAAADTRSPSATPQDNDGGLVFYNSYNASRGYEARLISPEIAYTEGSTPAISYFIYHYSSGNDELSIQVQKDGGEWVLVEGSTITVKGEVTGWKNYLVPLTSAVEDCQTYRVALYAHSDYGQNTVVDNISIFNQVAYDLEASTISGPTTLTAGKEATYTVALRNCGAYSVEGTNYQIQVNLGDRQVAIVDGVTIEPSRTQTFEIPVSATAPEVGEEEIMLEAIVLYDNDLNNDNNSVTTAVTVNASTNPAPLNVELTEQNNEILITWECPIVSDGYIATNIEEEFTDCVKGSTELNGWTSIDLDGDTNISGRYGWSSTQWIIPDFGTNTYAPRAKVGEMVGVSFAKNADSNDWLISPELNPYSGMLYTLEFDALSMDNVEINVEYSTTDNTPESFTPAETVAIRYGSNNQWYTYTVEIPGEAKYIAFHNNRPATTANNFILIDRIKITSGLPEVLGYNVYEEGERLNDELITETSYNVPTTTRSATYRNFAVSTVYPEGESVLSDIVTSVTTSVDTIAADLAGINITRGGIFVPSFARVYDVNGQLVATGDNFICLNNGIYIVTINNKAYKLMIK